MTEKSVTVFSDSSVKEFTGEVSGTGQIPLNGSSSNVIQKIQNSPPPSQPSTSVSQPLPYIPPVRPKSKFQRKRKSDQTTDLLSSMIKLQMRQLQLGREREREKLQCLSTIQGELTAIRATLGHCVGVSVIAAPIEEE